MFHRYLISIHALREEGDQVPCRAAPPPPWLSYPAPLKYSNPPPREEGDRRVVPLFGLTLYFYPRPPRGGRPPSQDRRGTTQNFYPRPPRGGRHDSTASTSSSSQFLSTPSARRATCRFSADCGVLRNFYPRPPRGGRRAVNALLSPFKPISIHALREEGDHTTTKQEDKNHISIHALREEGDY